jgi:hypothetical protein
MPARIPDDAKECVMSLEYTTKPINGNALGDNPEGVTRT